MLNATDSLLWQLFAIFVSAKLFGEVFERLRLPAVMGEILAGVLLGPYALHWIAPGETVHGIAGLGAVFLLFTVGLETSPTDLVRVGRASLGVALGGVLAPFLFCWLLLHMHREPAHEAIFVAAAMVATSVGITARVLRDMQVLRSRMAQIILGAAVFDDILGMLLLGVVVSMVSGGVRWLHLGVVAAEAVVFAAFMIFVAPRMVTRLEGGLGRLQTREAPLVLSLALCLGLSVLSTRLGLAAIIGAFFAGMALADGSAHWNLEPRVQAINQLLSPIFFFSMGSRLDLGVFQPQLLGLAATLSVLAVVTKVGGCGLALPGERWRDRLKVGVGMTPRGEVALIVALIGLQMQMISQRAYGLVIVVTAVTTLLAPPLLRVLFEPGDRSAEAAPPHLTGEIG